MRSVTHTEMTMIAGFLALIFAAVVLLQIPARSQEWLYPLVRKATVAKIDYETRQLAVRETDHFIIKFEPTDADMVDMVATAAEESYKPVTAALGHVPDRKTMIIMYPNRTELRKAFGWSGDQNAMGVYWGGVIQLLSPHAWMKEGDSVEEFIHSGPMVHEFTHLVFDYMTNGNYSRWFTEGLAQYVEYKANKYEWITANNRFDLELFTMQELDDDFDNLPNQALAYRQSLAAVRYIAEVHGEDKLGQVIQELKAGRSMDRAISNSLGMDYTAYDKAWREWAVDNMKNFEN
ncbi:hypothetical protein SDC9_03993 [bioreactor metagenome]|uniref:Peptidase MA-like domain-containing protein n=1 Tax=bioreactor metagenome TaxID=1076179 RepID=A0A644SUT9_9ZZZZ|nr:peptidase MA family metallohydrolase [Negativicutes bacterium]